MRFEWSPLKELLNIEKHKVSFREAIEVFKDPDAFDLEDKEHSEVEARQFMTGKILDGRIITVRFTVRDDVIRIFGAGEWRYFRSLYYEKTKHKKS
jgi:hypothetical protein